MLFCLRSYFDPLFFGVCVAPGEPYPIENYTPPASVPVPAPSVQSNAGRGSSDGTTYLCGNPFC